MARRSLSNAKGFDGIPAGWYKGTIDKLSVEKASEAAKKNPGTPMFHEIFRVSEGDHANHMVHSRWMIDEAITGSAKTKKFLTELNVNAHDFDDDEVCEQLTGVECWIQLGLKTNSAERAEQSGATTENVVMAHSITDPNADVAEEGAQEEAQPVKVAAKNGTQGTIKPAKQAPKGRSSVRA